MWAVAVGAMSGEGEGVACLRFDSGRRHLVWSQTCPRWRVRDRVGDGGADRGSFPQRALLGGSLMFGIMLIACVGFVGSAVITHLILSAVERRRERLRLARRRRERARLRRNSRQYIAKNRCAIDRIRCRTLGAGSN